MRIAPSNKGSHGQGAIIPCSEDAAPRPGRVNAVEIGEVWREKISSFGRRHRAELSFLDASNSDITCTESVTHNFALIVITQTAHIPGEEAVSSSASIHWTHNPHPDTNRVVHDR